MRNEIAQFDEVSLYAFGLDRVTVQTLRNIVRIVGTATQGGTVPELTEQTEATAADVVILTALAEALEADRLDQQGPDNAIARRLDDIEALLEQLRLDSAATLRRFMDDVAMTTESLLTANQQLTRRIADLETGAN